LSWFTDRFFGEAPNITPVAQGFYKRYFLTIYSLEKHRENQLDLVLL